MKLTAVYAGKPRDVEVGEKTVSTGIFKELIEGPVRVRTLNLDGDGQADLSLHGGRDKAVYAYPTDHYERWRQEIGALDLGPSPFGENLAVSGVSEQDVVLGDRYRVGSSEVVVTQPRLPCFKLGIRRQNSAFPRQFLDSGKLGFYLRVELEGFLQAGDDFERIDRPSHGITAYDLWQTVFQPAPNSTPADYALEQLPHLDEGWIRRLRRLATT